MRGSFHPAASAPRSRIGPRSVARRGQRTLGPLPAPGTPGRTKPADFTARDPAFPCQNPRLRIVTLAPHAGQLRVSPRKRGPLSVLGDRLTAGRKILALAI